MRESSGWSDERTRYFCFTEKEFFRLIEKYGKADGLFSDISQNGDMTWRYYYELGPNFGSEDYPTLWELVQAKREEHGNDWFKGVYTFDAGDFEGVAV
jgi:hypothetical protein